jgi:alkylation response protein AidB-like acyl-CoA dehydrogenase
VLLSEKMVGRMMKRFTKIGTRSCFSTTSYDLFNPTEQHRQLRQTLRSFVDQEVSKQSLSWDRDEKFNVDLFRKLGDLGLLGITVSEEYGGSGLIIRHSFSHSFKVWMPQLLSLLTKRFDIIITSFS